MRLASLRAAGHSRADIRRLLRLDADELYVAECWLRDALAAVRRGDD